MFWPAMHVVYDWSWFVGFGLGGGLYWLFMVLAPPAGPSAIPRAHVRT